MERKTVGRTIVAVLAITPKKEIILTKIYRVPQKKWVIEFCAGLMDKDGETEQKVAKRELLEETGYSADYLLPIIRGPFNSGLQADCMVIFVGMNAIQVAEPTLETGEDIEVLSIPFHKVEECLNHPEDDVEVDIKLFSAIYHPGLQRLLSR